MSNNIKDKVVQKGDEVVLQEANTMFDFMIAALSKDKGVTLKISQGYKSVYDVADELRGLVKDKTVSPPSHIIPLLDTKKTMKEILESSLYDSGSAPTLKQYLTDLDDASFEPPIKPIYTSIENTTVFPFPNKMDKDPRRTGKLYVVEPKEVFNSIEVQKWLINNSILYGFLLYDSNSLYYLGVDSVKEKIKGATDKQVALAKIVGTFMRNASSLSLLTLDPNKILTTSATPPTSNIDYETVLNHNTKDNNNKVPDLVVIDSKPVFRNLADKVMEMKNAAKRDGIPLVITSGFRPAYGQTYTGVTNKGNAITFDTQEAIRRNRSRWVNRGSWPGNDEDFVFNAPSSYFNPKTAPPGASNHGWGTAVDTNTGSRKKNNLNTTVYVWLVKNSWKYGFIRSVYDEEWHFDYLPAKAKLGPYGKLQNNETNLFYVDLGLNNLTI